MGIEFFIGGVLSGIVSIFLIYGFFRNYKNSIVNRATNRLSILCLGYLTIFLFSFLWMFGMLEYNDFDFTLIYSVVIVLQTFVLFKVFNVFGGMKKYFYLMFFYLAAFLPLAFSSFLIFEFLMVISYFLTLILATSLMKIFITRRNAIYILIVYSLVSLFSVFAVFIGVGELYFFSIINCFIFIFFCYYFLKDIDKYPNKSQVKDLFENESKIVLFIKYFIYVIVVINLVLISTIGVHEFGHVSTARYFGCESRTIVFEESSYPYSEILCDEKSDKFWIALAGPILPIAIALVLIFFSGTLLRPISFLVIGFNIIASYRDFLEVGASQNLTLAANVIGGICLLTGIVLLSRATTKGIE